MVFENNTVRKLEKIFFTTLHYLILAQVINVPCQQNKSKKLLKVLHVIKKVLLHRKVVIPQLNYQSAKLQSLIRKKLTYEREEIWKKNTNLVNNWIYFNSVTSSNSPCIYRPKNDEIFLITSGCRT